MEQVTIEMLESKVTWLNELTKDIRKDKYSLSKAYSGISLTNEQGNTSPLGCGHITKRDLYNRLDAFIKGVESVLEATRRKRAK